MGPQKHGDVSGPFAHSPQNYNKSNSYSSKENFQPKTQTYLRNLCSREPEGGKSAKLGRRKGNGSDTNAAEAAQSSLWDSGKQEESD